ncbi:protein-tyrosine phosphatase family protein [Halomicrobium salinisoli]|uniref:protein-tyrosine phosphatase family protein n=1 Tax=Halomicrobium salinisoli TaxID=2878391 RepID=UPI001CF07399|nr:dual specificity protein phosphatase family protein [Halomicrobium salinisoli]
MSDARSGVDAHRFAPAAPDEEYVYGACCPGWHSTAGRGDAVEEWIGFVRDRGIERVCCLLTGDQLDRTDAQIGRYRAAFGEDQVLHAPIPDHHLADVETLDAEVLPFLAEAVEREAPVVVHCLAGIGRTGHVLAAWLVHARDYDPVDAIETVEEMGRSPADAITSGNARRGELHELLAKFA